MCRFGHAIPISTHPYFIFAASSTRYTKSKIYMEIGKKTHYYMCLSPILFHFFAWIVNCNNVVLCTFAHSYNELCVCMCVLFPVNMCMECMQLV